MWQREKRDSGRDKVRKRERESARGKTSESESTSKKRGRARARAREKARERVRDTDTYRHPQTYTVAPKIVPTPSDPHRSLMPSARCMHLPRRADDSCTLRQNCNCVTVHVSLGAEMPNDVGPRVTVDGGRRRILEQYNVTPRPPPYSSTMQRHSEANRPFWQPKF